MGSEMCIRDRSKAPPAAAAPPPQAAATRDTSTQPVARSEKKASKPLNPAAKPFTPATPEGKADMLADKAPPTEAPSAPQPKPAGAAAGAKRGNGNGNGKGTTSRKKLAKKKKGGH